MKQIVTIFDIIRLRTILSEELGEAFSVHMTDACGGQVMRLETPATPSLEELQRAHVIVTRYFLTRAIHIDFDSSGKSFWVRPQTS